jgi:hypothetical protein
MIPQHRPAVKLNLRYSKPKSAKGSNSEETREKSTGNFRRKADGHNYWTMSILRSDGVTSSLTIFL